MAKRMVVLTGVTRGLGRAMAEEFMRLGHTVAGCGRAERDIAALHGKFGPPHDFRTVDIASYEAVRAWARELLKSHGPPDLLLNNAGVINQNAPLWKISAPDFARV